MRKELLFFKQNGYLKYPKILNMEITNRCPLHCPQCYKDPNMIQDMDINFAKNMIDQAAVIGIRRVMLNGGEPLVYPHFLKLVEYLNEHNILPTCFTSGIGVDEYFVDRLSKFNIEIMLSFNGSQKEIHNSSRDAFDVTYSAAKIFMEKKYKYGINWVARHDNLDDFPRLIEMAKAMGCIGITVVCNKVNGHNYVESPLTRADYEVLKKYILENHQYVTIQNCNNILAQFSYNMPYSRLYGCPAGISSMCVTVDEKFVPCPHLYFKEDSFNADIIQYWVKSEYLNKLRSLPTSKLSFCNACERKNRCNFCRAICLESHDDLTMGYKGCPLYIGGTQSETI